MTRREGRREGVRNGCRAGDDTPPRPARPCLWKLPSITGIARPRHPRRPIRTSPITTAPADRPDSFIRPRRGREAVLVVAVLLLPYSLIARLGLFLDLTPLFSVAGPSALFTSRRCAAGRGVGLLHRDHVRNVSSPPFVSVPFVVAVGAVGRGGGACGLPRHGRPVHDGEY